MLMLVVEFLCFFFFKQKTAYEMRISDWRSDVCSSDLGKDVQAYPAADRSQRGREPGQGGRCRRRAGAVFRQPTPRHDHRSALRRGLRVVVLSDRLPGQGGEDRKSVVKGKRVPVRVDLGGRRIIKKQK